mmetsp:Transcript_28400/g.81745  ORF Transcript_28400/g.81745 Transcript_28400/m.81745 type:complete len:600 (+) Transcript_28400:2-1801(+)
MQQGGVSKATKTLNLSEDIFAGMDFVLRGQGRLIQHAEYFHLAKGRDLGFSAVIGFFSKLSSGTGEQMITRQMGRLHRLLPLPEALSFYYAHGGFYITQTLVSWSMPIVVFTWLLMLGAQCEDDWKAFMHCPDRGASEAMTRVLSYMYSYVLLLYLLASSMPLFVELWMERSLKIAVSEIMKQYITGAFLLFIFQAKVIGSYILNEIRYGGATYVSTGRTLPTQRHPFIGKPAGAQTTGLYLDFAGHTYYDGILLLFGACLVPCVGGGWPGSDRGLIFGWISIIVTIVSWLYAPFLFNPYQFSSRYFRDDLRGWCAFFFRDGGRHWVEWYDKKFLLTRRGFTSSVVDANFFLACFGLVAWFTVVNLKQSVIRRIFSTYYPGYFSWLQLITIIPPVGLAAAYCAVVALLELCRRPACRSEASSDDTADSEATAAHGGRCAVPLWFSAIVVAVLQAVELVGPLLMMRLVGWNRAFVAGIVLKVMLLETLIFLAEGLLTSRCFHRAGCLGQWLRLYVQANRMARDIGTSSFIFWTLAVGVPLNSLNEAVCPGCNLHLLLLYRDPGHLQRKEADIVDLIGTDLDSDTSGGDTGASSSNEPLIP